MMESTSNLINHKAGTSKNLSHAKLSISDSGVYSFLSICAICLPQLFPSEWNAEFNRNYIKKLCQYLGANKRIESVMLVFVEGNSSHECNPYIELLLQEKTFSQKAIVIIQHAVLFAVQNGEYDARQRVLARRLAELFKVPFDLIELYEHSLVNLLSKETECRTEEEKKETERRDKIRRIKRYASVGIATIAGGTLIGLTGGLAAPFIGVGVGTILGGASAAALTSTAGVAIIGSVFGVAGAGLTGYKMNKRVGQLEEFCFEPLSKYSVTDQQLHIAIAVTGWLNNEDSDSITKPWRFLAISREQYALRYETKYLIELGQALEYILSIAISFATQEALKYTVLSGLMSAIAWPTALLSMSSVIDNPWSVCCRRSSEVGKHLAHVLLSRQHGKRPVTLIGYSLGARVIFYCLRELSELGRSQGIIQDAIMLGAPVTNKQKQWEKCTKVVAGKIINGYCPSDWLLKFLYRTLSMTSGVAGLMPIDCPRVKNIDLGSVISGHIEYSNKLLEIIEFVGVKTRSINALDDKGVLKKSISEYPAISKPISNLSLRGSKSDESLNVFHLQTQMIHKQSS
ncbi:transmembrane and coiled-coil domain-containing protein 4-like isoform X2 [Chelonus insularis]|uniref:transmembrane and coiled-coil domain-containing protein 4-like isoform X2 n=1 Tax=Chelonus insularis TaxID=460826 RepID=UPI00158A50E8|nr:transmembrane and coiled-coil domain-containing protein 4-like isoform X2 [Chelonus insularis]